MLAVAGACQITFVSVKPQQSSLSNSVVPYRKCSCRRSVSPLHSEMPRVMRPPGQSVTEFAPWRKSNIFTKTSHSLRPKLASGSNQGLPKLTIKITLKNTYRRHRINIRRRDIRNGQPSQTGSGSGVCADVPLIKQ